MRTTIQTIFLSTMAFLFSCNYDSPTSIPVDIATKEELKDGDTLSKTADTIIIKDGEINDTLIKYKPLAFTDYSVRPEEIKLNKKLDFSNYEYKKLYRTSTANDVNEHGMNFAGHFCFAFWGCGSPCKLSAVVDLKTGKVYNGVESGLGYSFRKDSRLLIVNPPDSTNWYDVTVPYAIPEAYEWTGTKFRRIKTSS
jgi:hypothetical protein